MVNYQQPYCSSLVWQKADKFLLEVYQLTASFPKEELYGVTSQFRRAALSVVLNVVEGKARGSQKEFLRFLFIARASLSECAYLLEFSFKVGYINQEAYNKLEFSRRNTSYFLQQAINGITNPKELPNKL
ncbi:MAG: S23 ribosomal protein [Candidatus Uhrbacteria bacterium GW2011_GWE2_45_35]|uniref:S23 ribosomal protein n=2 Tax=Candidatus Uhriibacteriota TaxID=1752732 RepID=A0A0G1MI93_9BACT|nr:MAG: S23 ribosomal protein [Candidatus Uhrbacteria bacterium GW2011_GWF2_44_350]KKU08450.1 MAG: S23 ribosomal protein [Candidatus Uhrbacteria bacterium GW2011_GWE2_45_35]HBR80791.1 four helix bundle protein [Candidatus Uhrbacteria bacterium]